MTFPSRKVMLRFTLICLLFVGLAILIMGKMGYMMVAESDYWRAVKDKADSTRDTIHANRGTLYADGGEVLAASVPEYELFMDFMSWESDPERKLRDQRSRDDSLRQKLDSISEGMARILRDKTAEEYRRLILEGRRNKSHYWKLCKRRVNYIEYSELKKLPILRLSAGAGGFIAEDRPARKMPFGKLARRTIGYLNSTGDTAVCGLELGLDTLLRGHYGLKHTQKVFNRRIPVIDLPAVDGYDIYTTLNVVMQDMVEDALTEKLKEVNANYGLCILMEVATGDIKAITTLSRNSQGEYTNSQNWAVQQLIAPGSVFKPMSLLVALNDGLISMNDIVNTGKGLVNFGKEHLEDVQHTSGGNGSITLTQCIERSSNVGISLTINRLYKNNPEAFIAGLEKLGLREDLNLPIPGVTKPYIPRPKTKRWYGTTLPWMSIGYETQIPPIVTLMFYNGIANNGRMLRPRIHRAIKRTGEEIEEQPISVVREHLGSLEHIHELQNAMHDVVHGNRGTAKAARSNIVDIAGKTGTAQVWDAPVYTGKRLLSFAGFFPYEKPKYSMIVCIHTQGVGGGGVTCAPVFRTIAEEVMGLQRTSDISKARDSINAHAPIVAAGSLEAAQDVLTRLGYEARSLSDKADAPWGQSHVSDNTAILTPEAGGNVGIMPDLSGYSLRDAIYRLESMGLKVEVHGVGLVSRQSIAAGSGINRSDVVVLTLGNYVPPTGDIDSLFKAAEPTRDSAAISQKPTTETTKAHEDKPQKTEKKNTEPDKKKPEPKKKSQARKPDAPEPKKTAPTPKKDTPKPQTSKNKPAATAPKQTEAKKKTVVPQSAKSDVKKNTSDTKKKQSEPKKKMTETNKPKADNKKTK